MELLISVSILGLIAVVLGSLASAVHTTTEYTEGHSDAAQHSRVTLERITRMVNEAHAVDKHPGFAVVETVVGNWYLPETLVVWHPEGVPANPEGPPLIQELVIYCPNPKAPNQLVEITCPTDTRPIPLDEVNSTYWRAELEAIKVSSSSESVLLTDLLRPTSITTKTLSGGTAFSNNRRHGAIRFEQELRPSVTAWNGFKSGVLEWDQLAWPQGIYGKRSGLRQNWLRIEMQLMPGAMALNTDSLGRTAVPFLGSASLYYSLEKE